MYYHPFLRTKPAGVEAQSYALRTLAEIGPRPHLSLDREGQDAVRADALDASALWGRYWLIPFRNADATAALTEHDNDALRKLRDRRGFYSDPEFPGTDDATRLGATWTAVETMAATRSLTTLSGPERRATVEWLEALAARTDDLSAAGVLARTLGLLGAPVPARLVAMKAPDMKGFAALDGQQRLDRLNDTFGYVQVRQAAHRKPALDAAAWREVLKHNVETFDYEQLYYAVHIVRAAGASGDAFTAVRERLDANRLDDGTIRDPDAYQGSVDASLWVARLRRLGGLPTGDPDLLRALEQPAEPSSQGSAADDAAEQLHRAALFTLLGRTGKKTAADRADTSACSDDSSADPESRLLPATVTSANAGQWQRLATECAEAGAEVGVPEAGRWSTNTPEDIAAAAALVLGLHDAGLAERTPDWLTPELFSPWARNAQRLGSVYDYAQVVRAYLLLGGSGTPELRTAVKEYVRPYRGCPELPDLYRIGGDDPGCDLKTTWAVWALDRQVPGLVPTFSKAPNATSHHGE